jgi:hypothetical protein
MFTITAIQWIPTLEFIFHSARSVDQVFWQQDGWFIPYQHLMQFIIPDFFGNPATLNYWGVWNYAEFSGYIGILPLLFVLLAIIFRHDKKTWFFAVVTLVALLFALPTPLGKLPYQLNIPFLSTSQPTRLLAIVDLALSILVALGADYFIQKKSYKMFLICGGVFTFFVLLWSMVLWFHLGISLEQISIIKRNLVLPSIFFFVSTIILALGVLYRLRGWKIFFAVICLMLVSVDLLRFADKFLPFSAPSYLYPHDKVLSYLQSNIGEYRYMTDDSRIMAPNFSVMYKLQSIDGYDPLYLRNYAELIISSEREKPDIHAPFGFNRIITPHNYNSRIMDLLGVKYVLSLNDIHIQKLTKVFQEGDTRVYENKQAVPRAFFVKNIVLAQTKQQSINALFAIQNLQHTAVIDGSLPNVTYTQGSVYIATYQPNKIILQTQNNGEGFLVLTDVYYPTWHAAVDGKETKILPVDYALRGLVVPKGKHTITFFDTLF